MNTSNQIDTSSLPRIEADEQMARDAGLVFKKPTLFAHGTTLYDSGKETYKRSRAYAHAAELLEQELKNGQA